MPGTLLQGVKGSFNPLENVDKSNADRKSKHMKVLIWMLLIVTIRLYPIFIRLLIVTIRLYPIFKFWHSHCLSGRKWTVILQANDERNVSCFKSHGYMY